MNLTSYLKEAYAELSHVVWPTRKQATLFTALVVGISLVVAIYLGAADYLFTRLIESII